MHEEEIRRMGKKAKVRENDQRDVFAQEGRLPKKLISPPELRR